MAATATAFAPRTLEANLKLLHRTPTVVLLYTIHAGTQPADMTFPPVKCDRGKRGRRRYLPPSPKHKRHNPHK